MNKTFVRTLIVLTLCIASTAFAKPDKRGCTDHPLFPTRMPEYYIVDCQTREFDGYDFFTAKPPKLHQEGRFTYIAYLIENRKNEQSGLAMVRNYENAITKIGGTIAASDPNRWVNGKVVVDGKEVWVQAEKGNGAIWLRIIEKQQMQQHIVADAASFANDLKATGHVVVQGIFFDTGKSVVKPESKPALDEVAKLLKADATLKLWVVGHTDSVGKVEDNMRLAQARAEAVAAELVSAHAIAAARLKGYGVGPLAPVAGNDAEEGRAKNRRVELVKQP
ncbi:MAG: OmpA family protein [Betaproteobacteria bacterium]|nr:OmpA family protein [Betaproteobacteria bacterium]